MLPRRLALCLTVVALLCADPARAQGLRRFAVVAGNDTGGEDTRELLYARADARKLHGLLLRLGEVKPEDARLLLDGNARELLAALSEVERLSAKARAGGERTALILYYSGHAKDGALRLGESRIAFDTLKARLSAAPADVRIGIFDSCRSGELTRTKGARRAPDFEVTSAGPAQARGMVLLTSSAADEDSQESDLVRGSYFSHHLASGLLGDADRSGDGQVTLGEAYAYAYDRTVADTATSSAGAQHPTFSYDLSGNGDLVMTDLGRRKEGLLLPAGAPSGVYFLVDVRGQVAAEVWKPEATERRIALAPGVYRVKRRLGDRLRIGEVKLSSGGLTTLDETTLRDAPFSDDPVKGAALSRTVYALGLSGQYQSFFDAPTRAGLFPPAPLLGMELAIRGFPRRDWVFGLDVALGAARGSVPLASFSVPYRFSELSVGSTVTVGFPSADWTPFLGGRLSLLLMTRRFEDPALPSQAFSTFSPGVVFGLERRLGAHWFVTGRGRVHYLLYNIEEDRSLGYWELAAIIGHEL